MWKKYLKKENERKQDKKNCPSTIGDTSIKIEDRTVRSFEVVYISKKKKMKKKYEKKERRMSEAH